MKTLLPLMILVVLSLLFGLNDRTVAAQAPPHKINWLSLDKALALAEKQNKPIVIDVYTDWCGWCKKMDKDTFSNTQIIDYINKNYYAVKLNAESNEEIMFDGQKLAYSQISSKLFKVTGYPAIVYISTDGEITTVAGYQTPTDFEAYLKHFNK